MIDDDETNAIEALNALAKIWPRTLWLFTANGTLNVMRCSDDGGRAITPVGSMDSSYAVASIDIPADGGDW